MTASKKKTNNNKSLTISRDCITTIIVHRGSHKVMDIIYIIITNYMEEDRRPPVRCGHFFCTAAKRTGWTCWLWRHSVFLLVSLLCTSNTHINIHPLEKIQLFVTIAQLVLVHLFRLCVPVRLCLSCDLFASVSVFAWLKPEVQPFD